MDPPKPKTKTKTKTFTGCWTCRSRKVKCDLGRPHCQRCIKARLQCQGYNVPLFWVAQDEVSQSSYRRQAMSLPLGNPHWPAGQVNDVDEHLQDVDRLAATARPEGLWSGPFGIFCARNNGDECGLSQTVSPPFIRQTSPLDSITTSSNDSPDLTLSNDDPLVLYSSETAVATEDSGALPDESSNMLLTARPHHNRAGSGSVPDFPNADAQAESLVSNLLDHYLRNVATLLQPVVHSQNAYSSIYANQAMAVARRVPWRDAIKSWKVWDSKVALVYSLLSSSTSHLRGLDGTDDASAMARYFRVEAVSRLRGALNSLDLTRQDEMGVVADRSLSECEAVLSVMLTLVTADVMDGQMEEFWIHLDATKALVSRLRGHVQPGSPGAHLVNISTFLRILSDSTDVGLEPLPWRPDSDGPADFIGAGHSLEYTYGITARLVNFLSRACLLSRNAAFYKLGGCRPPEAFSLECDRFIEEIDAWHISEEEFTSFRTSDDVTILLASKHTLAFAAGIRIYFHARVVPCGGPTMRALVQSVAEQLTDIEKIKRRTGYDATPTATISWPGFMASCQAEPSERRVWEEWWNQMLGYRIGNMKGLWSVVREAWSVHDQAMCESDDAPWAVVLRRTGRRILAI